MIYIKESQKNNHECSFNVCVVVVVLPGSIEFGGGGRGSLSDSRMVAVVNKGSPVDCKWMQVEC